LSLLYIRYCTAAAAAAAAALFVVVYPHSWAINAIFVETYSNVLITAVRMRIWVANIPTTETRQVLESLLAANLTDHKTSNKILHCYDIIVKQNYFFHGEKTFTQTHGLALGAPSSSIMSEVFLQQIKYGWTTEKRAAAAAAVQ
jgi:hypothetical protein